VTIEHLMQTRFITASAAAVNQHSDDRGAGRGDLSSGQAVDGLGSPRRRRSRSRRAVAPPNRVYRPEQAAGGSRRRAR